MFDMYKIDIEYLPNYNVAKWGPLTSATTGSAGVDLRACHKKAFKLEPGQTKLVPLGIKSSFSPRLEAQLRARSGLAKRYNLCLMNGVGTVDSDYREEWGCLLHNAGKDPVEIKPGERICQVVFNLLPRSVTINVVESVKNNTDRKGGFGSTGL